MVKKVVALLMAAMMLLSMMPAYAAADNAAQIGKYYEVNDNNGTLPANPALSEGSTEQVYSANGEKLLWIDKTIAPTGTENLFDVTLKVVTGQKIENIDLTEDAATVLVIDVSGSMDHEDNDDTSRLERAQRAAQTFINSFANVDGNVKRKVAIVKFSTTASTVSGSRRNRGWVDASSVATESNDDYCKPIDDLESDGGTNIEAGMILARNLLKDPAIADIKNKNIVLLTDGKPTYGVTDRGANTNSTTSVPSNGSALQGDGMNTSCNTHTDVETISKSLKGQHIGMYAVYIGDEDVRCRTCPLDKTGRDWLAKDCGFAAYAATDANKLVQIFENISLQIVARAQAWVVTDPMGDMVDYVKVVDADQNSFKYEEGEETVVWDLKKDLSYKTDKETGRYTYTAKYRISLDTMADSFEEGIWYATNKETQVTWVLLDKDGNITGADQEGGGVRKAYFNVPSVQGYKAQIKKVDDVNQALAGAEFLLEHSAANCPHCTATVANAAAWASVKGISGDDGTIVFNGDDYIPSGHTYTLKETKAPDGYELAAAPLNVVVAYGEANGADPLNLPNYPETTEATIVKVWDDANNQDGKRPANLTVTLSNGAEVTLNEGNHWTATVKNLPKYANGTEIVYTWTEGTMPEGYRLSKTVRDGTVTTLTNSRTPETTEATIVKVWDDANNQDKKRPANLTVTLSNGAKVTLNEGNNWTETVKNLPKYANGTEIVYTWTEGAMPEGYRLTSTVTEGTVTTLTNSRAPELRNITVQKVWNDNGVSAQRPNSITVNLLADGVVIDTKSITPDSWTYTFTGLPRYKAGKEIVYTVTEEAVDGYTPSIDGFTITNSRDTGALKVSKTVVGALASDNNPRFGFTVTLSDTSINGTFGEMTFNAGVATFLLADGEKVTATGLPTGVTYTVEEDEKDYFTNTGATGATGTITAGTAVAAFTNTRKGTVKLTLPVTKKVVQVGNVTPPAQNFKFVVRLNLAAAMAIDAVDAGKFRVTINGESQLLSGGDKFEFVINTNGAGSFSEDIEIAGNEEDLRKLSLSIVEDASSVPDYWNYDDAQWTASIERSGDTLRFVYSSSKGGAQDKVLFTNNYDQTHYSFEFPFTKTVVQKGVTGVGQNVFYFEIVPVYNGDAGDASVMKVEAVSDCRIAKVSDTVYAMTVSGACTAKAKIVLAGDKSELPDAIEMRELTSLDGSVTYKTRLAQNWTYDQTAKDVQADGEAYYWLIQPADGNWDDAVVQLIDHNGNVVARGDAAFVNEYAGEAIVPQTGDKSNLALWLALLVMSALGFVVLGKRARA